jgi:ABC-type nickel/cobalt efflux system permease component RcnA
VVVLVAVVLVVSVALATHRWVYGTRKHPRDPTRVFRTRRVWVLRAGIAACASACMVLFLAREPLTPVLGPGQVRGLFLTCMALGVAIMYGALPPQRDL